MSSDRPMPDDEVDALVRRHLADEAATVDPRRILAGVRTRQARPVRRSGWRRLVVGAAAAAAIVLAFLGGLAVHPAQASAEALVSQAREVHALPVDRCYLVQITPEPGILDRFPTLAQPRQTRLWTRGDRFWMESVFPERPWAWGRDDQGQVWFARGSSEGFRFDADEVPEAIAVACDVFSLRLESLLTDVLTDYDLQREGTTTATRVVRAKLKPGRRPLVTNEVILEMDAETKVLQRLQLDRLFRGQRLARAVFSLVETGTQNDARYRLDGHLDADAKVFTRDFQPLRRRILLALLFPPRRS